MRIKVTGSHRRYVVEDLEPGGDETWLEKKLHEHRFRSIDRAANAMVSCGWVTIGRPWACRFGTEEIWRGPYLCLGLRIDKKSLPANSLRIRLMETIETERKSRSAERLTRERRAELREKIESEILARTVPSTQLFQVIWKVKSGEILFSSASQNASASFVRHFARTFGRQPIAATPATAARCLELPVHAAGRLVNLEPFALVGPSLPGRDR